jgi:hypothetical protein
LHILLIFCLPRFFFVFCVFLVFSRSLSYFLSVLSYLSFCFSFRFYLFYLLALHAYSLV